MTSLSEGIGSGCQPPGLTLNGRKVTARANAAPDYASVTEVKFSAQLASPLELGPDKRLCKIKCIDGQWVGPLCQHDNGNLSGIFVMFLIKYIDFFFSIKST